MVSLQATDIKHIIDTTHATHAVHTVQPQVVAQESQTPLQEHNHCAGRNATHHGSSHHSGWYSAFCAALPVTAPIGLGFLFLGSSYGMLMGAQGFAVWYPMAMSFCIFAGSMEFVTIHLLQSAFNPLAAGALAFLVNSRHLFYGIGMLQRFAGTGWAKFPLIYGLCDESFAIHIATRAPRGVDQLQYMLAVTWLNQAYWVGGATLGGLIGAHLPGHTQGLDFVLTALFVVIGIDQGVSGRAGMVIGLGATTVCLIVAGSANFMVPSLICIVALCLMLRSRFA